MCTRKILLLAFSVTLLSGFGEKQVQTVEFYKNNKDKRFAVIEYCRADPIRFKKDGNCQNAVKASKMTRRQEGTRAIQVDTESPFN